MNKNYVEFKVQSLQDQTLNTGVEIYELTKGEIFIGKFKSSALVNNFIEAGIIIKTNSIIPLEKPIPVILLDEEGKELPLCSELISNFLKA